jgi:hypothetical protein
VQWTTNPSIDGSSWGSIHAAQQGEDITVNPRARRQEELSIRHHHIAFNAPVKMGIAQHDHDRGIRAAPQNESAADGDDRTIESDVNGESSHSHVNDAAKDR